MTNFHIPVMCAQVLTYLITNKKGIYVDCTLGGGGHSKEIMKEIYPDGMLVGLDQDIEALEYAREYLSPYQDKAILLKSNFAHLEMLLHDLGLKEVTGILFDLGLSSHQIGVLSRGFSFMEDHPLDMRMDLSSQLNAYDVVNHYSEKDLWEIFSKYGEERFSRTIARMIVEKRKHNPIKTTGELAKLVTDLYARRKKGKWRIHPATRVFQALRIEVNNELGILEAAIKQGIHFLGQGGRICVISYHSLEDRIIKHTFKKFAARDSVNQLHYGLKIITKKPFYPSDNEIKENRRARSARMRVAEKIFLEDVSRP